MRERDRPLRRKEGEGLYVVPSGGTLGAARTGRGGRGSWRSRPAKQTSGHWRNLGILSAAGGKFFDMIIGERKGVKPCRATVKKKGEEGEKKPVGKGVERKCRGVGRRISLPANRKGRKMSHFYWGGKRGERDNMTKKS